MKTRLRYHGTANAYFVVGVVIIVLGIILGVTILVFGVGSLVVNNEVLGLFFQNNSFSNLFTFNNIMILLFLACIVAGLGLIIGGVLLGLVFIGMRTIIRAQDHTLARVDMLLERLTPLDVPAGQEPPAPVPETTPPAKAEEMSAIAPPENLGF
jgi:hypothetical protein